MFVLKPLRLSALVRLIASNFLILNDSPLCNVGLMWTWNCAMHDDVCVFQLQRLFT